MNRHDSTNLPAKYLPPTLGDLRGQPAAVAALQSFVSHARESGSSAPFIFHGPTGVGKTCAAWAMAFDLGCDRDDPYMGGVSELPSGKQDGAAVEDLLRMLTLRPLFGSGWKVAIINEADLMTRQAEGIWLDGLERLPPRTAIVFTTNALTAISGRLFSRCESVEFTGDPALIRDELHAFVRHVWKRETGKTLRRVPDGLGLWDIAGGQLSFRLALQQIAPYCRSGAPLPDRFQPPIVRDSDTVRNDTYKVAALKAVATRRARRRRCAMSRKRTLNLNDVGAVSQLPDRMLDELAAPIIARLRAIPVITSIDLAGIPCRGMCEYYQAVGLQPAIAVAAARRRLHQLRALLYVIDALECMEVLAPDDASTAAAGEVHHA